MNTLFNSNNIEPEFHFDHLVTNFREIFRSKVVIEPFSYKDKSLSSRISSMTEALPTLKSPRLLICRHALEHLPDPFAFLKAFQHQYDYLYLEVPAGFNSLNSGLWYTLWDQHAHYFSEASLVNLASKAGWSKVFLQRYDLGTEGIVAALFSPSRQGEPLLKHGEDLPYDALINAYSNFKDKVSRLNQLTAREPFGLHIGCGHNLGRLFEFGLSQNFSKHYYDSRFPKYSPIFLHELSKSTQVNQMLSEYTTDFQNVSVLIGSDAEQTFKTNNSSTSKRPTFFYLSSYFLCNVQT
jgi:hypothetical protein